MQRCATVCGSHGHRPDRSFANPHDDAVLRPLSSEPSTEEAIRRSANAALSAAILYSTSGYIKDNRITRDMLLDYARWHIRSISCAHGSISRVDGEMVGRAHCGLWSPVKPGGCCGTS